jgi:hypothetical protein
MPLDTERDGLEGVRDLHGQGVSMQRWNIGIIQAELSRSKRFYPAQVLEAAAPPFNNKPVDAIPPPMGLTAAIAARRFDGAMSLLETALHRAARLRRMDRKLAQDTNGWQHWPSGGEHAV